MFDRIIEQVSARYGLGTETAKQLLGMLVALIFNEKRGGPAGFARAFRDAGLGHLVASWVGPGINQPITNSQLESVLGSGLLTAMASRLGLDLATTTAATGALLPEAVNALSENGELPAGLAIPERFRGFVDGIGDFVGDIGKRGWGVVATGAAAAAGGVREANHAAVKGVNTVRGKKMGLLRWPVLLAALIAIAFIFRGCGKKEDATQAPAADTIPVQGQTAAQTGPRFNFEYADGKARIAGQVATQTEKAKLWDALRSTFGDANVEGDITVDGHTAPAAWLDQAVALLPDLKHNGVKLGLSGHQLNLDTSSLPEADRFALSAKLRDAFRGFEIAGLWDKAMAAFSALKTGATADDLVRALNLATIYFDTGSSSITADSVDVLRKAAEAIQRAPAGTRIAVNAYTDNTGDAKANQDVSQARAEAVKAKLVELGVPAERLDARGHGQENPIAPNSTEAGRAMNRRMEFQVAN